MLSKYYKKELQRLFETESGRTGYKVAAYVHKDRDFQKRYSDVMSDGDLYQDLMKEKIKIEKDGTYSLIIWKYDPVDGYYVVKVVPRSENLTAEKYACILNAQPWIYM